MTLDPKLRPNLFVLLAANIEISRAPWISSESLISEIRLRWWLEAFEEIGSEQAVRRHFVTSPLEGILNKSQTKLIKENIAARSWDINFDPHAGQKELLHYIDCTSGNIWAVAAELLGGSQKIGRFLGNAIGAVQYCKASNEFIERGRVPFPKPEQEIIQIFLQWGKTQLDEGLLQVEKLPKSKKAIRRFAWDTNFYLNQFFSKTRLY
jgi:phytoene/squalene synthetase